MTRASESREEKAERVYRELTGRVGSVRDEPRLASEQADHGVSVSPVENAKRVRQIDPPALRKNVVDMREWLRLRGRA